MGKLQKTIMLLFCFIIAGITGAYLVLAYEPNMNSVSALSSVCMDVICILSLIILVLNLALENKEINRTTKLFLWLMIGTAVGLFFDFFNWAFDGKLEFSDYTYVFTVCSLCMGSIVAGVFVLYLGSYLAGLYRFKNAFKFAKICALCNVVSCLVTIVLALTHTAFTYTNGHYSPGALYDVVTAIPIMTLLFMTGYVVFHVKTIGIHDVMAVVGYILFMICGALIESGYGIGTTYVSIAIADNFIFVMLQNKLIERERENVQKWIQKSNTDELSGFYNRNAYEDEISSFGIDKLRENFVYVSIDVNSLKVVNDSLGHDAGDELIRGASYCLKQCLGSYGKLYRTGGDEFAALIYADEAQLAEIKKDIIDVTEGWEGKYSNELAIACGYVSRKESTHLTIRQMAALADKRMYEDKRKYYQEKGINRRGQRDAHVALLDSYAQILKINATYDFYEIVNMKEEDKANENVFAERSSERFINYAKSGLVHEDDVKDYLNNINVEKIKSFDWENNSVYRFFYRRKDDNRYVKVMVEFIKASDYSEDSQSFYVYIKDIE